MFTFGDVVKSGLCLARRVVSHVFSNIMAYMFLYGWYNHGGLNDYSPLSIAFGFGCIATALYDWYLCFAVPYTRAWLNTYRIYRHWKSHQDITVLE